MTNVFGCIALPETFINKTKKIRAQFKKKTHSLGTLQRIQWKKKNNLPQSVYLVLNRYKRKFKINTAQKSKCDIASSKKSLLLLSNWGKQKYR